MSFDSGYILFRFYLDYLGFPACIGVLMSSMRNGMMTYNLVFDGIGDTVLFVVYIRSREASSRPLGVMPAAENSHKLVAFIPGDLLPFFG